MLYIIDDYASYVIAAASAMMTLFTLRPCRCCWLPRQRLLLMLLPRHSRITLPSARHYADDYFRHIIDMRQRYAAAPRR